MVRLRPASAVRLPVLLPGYGLRVTLRTFSNGGGVQSSAALVLSVQGRIDFPVHLWANVGDDSEHPATLAYVRDVLMPYAEANGIEFHELRRVPTKGASKGIVETLYGRLTKEGSRSLPIPVRMSNGAPGTRLCTMDFKMRVMQRWRHDHGATAASPASVGIGFSTDEVQRIGKATAREFEVVEYPLIDLGLSRADCLRIVADAGLPTPPKSSCWFCPFHRPQVWSEMRRDEPELFWQSVKLERLLNDRRDELGKDHVYLTRFAKPLDEAIGEAQRTLFDQGPAGEFETCDEGVCFV